MNIPFSSSDLSPGAEALLQPYIGEPLVENDMQEVALLERRSRVVKLLRSYFTPVTSNPDKYVLDAVDAELPSPQHIGSQLARRVTAPLLCDDFDKTKQFVDEYSPGSEDERVFFEVSMGAFQQIHTAAHKYLADHDISISRAVLERFSTTSRNGHYNESAFSNNDRYQFSGRESSRSLDNMLRSGIELFVEPAGLDVLDRALTESAYTGMPVTELTKNESILSINGFGHSKLSLGIHDAIDHVSTFTIARDSGLFIKYAALFDSIGNPQQTDIFKREGEILASLSFGMRYWEDQPGFVPILSYNDLVALFNRAGENGLLHKRHEAANDLLGKLPETEYDEQRQNLLFVISNYLVTLMEQRRRYGVIKQKGRDGSLTELSPIDPDFLSFMIELHNEIFSQRDSHLGALQAVHTKIEAYLSDVAKRRIKADATLVLRSTTEAESGSNLDQATHDWMRKNYRFSTIKERIKQ